MTDANSFYVSTDPSGMHCVLSSDGERRIPVGRSNDAKQQADAIADLLNDRAMPWWKTERKIPVSMLMELREWVSPTGFVYFWPRPCDSSQPVATPDLSPHVAQCETVDYPTPPSHTIAFELGHATVPMCYTTPIQHGTYRRLVADLCDMPVSPYMAVRTSGIHYWTRSDIDKLVDDVGAGTSSGSTYESYMRTLFRPCRIFPTCSR